MSEPDRPPIPKPARSFYRRHLPHLQAEGKPLFVTFSTAGRWVLPEEVRSLVPEHCLHDHGSKLWMHTALAFDHVLRSDESVREKAQYICDNPVRWGLVAKADDYPWLWRDWVEGAVSSQ